MTVRIPVTSKAVSFNVKQAIAPFSGLILLVSLLCLAGPPAVAQSCWSVLTYDKRGVAKSEDRCGNREADKQQKGNSLEKEIEAGELLIADPPIGTETKLERLGYKVIEKMTFGRLDTKIWLVKSPDGLPISEALKELARELPGVQLDTNDLMDLGAGPTNNAPLPFDRRAVGWGLVPNSCGQGLKLGMIDGSVDINHPALKNQRIHYQTFIKKGRKEAAFDHGTAVAVMLVGEPGIQGYPGGLLPGAELYAAGIFEYRKGKEKGNLAAMLRAINWLAEKNVQLVNLSIAGAQNKIMKLILTRLTEKKILAVAAAGNNGANAQPAWPAAHPNVLAVTAINQRLGVYQWANQGNYIDFAAPGVDIETLTRTGRKAQSGTSFAAPYITGITALHLLAGYPPDVKRIRASMQRYSKDLGQEGKDLTYGWGLVRLKPNC
ncbi:S8 family serine peptidase [Aestuariispira insulae]|uniref:Subtilisin family serine protease n=1 Tax=Aestuariispira insulae TaxID=1461337 RepID=A0A3D9HXI4_9PROT|nr:S8 family serine peptidase [Aestuariispira insulae]RED54125.1 subtilisin family serine protease [Aestuariispira insulae]